MATAETTSSLTTTPARHSSQSQKSAIWHLGPWTEQLALALESAATQAPANACIDDGVRRPSTLRDPWCP